MRIERIRVGMELLNKLDGKTYKVTSVSGAIGTAVMMPDDPDAPLDTANGETVVITEENALAFRILSDPEPYPVPFGYTVSEDGLLLKNGLVACLQGEYRFAKVMALWHDRLILTARTKGMPEGEVMLVSYQVSRDRFTKLDMVPESIAFLGYAGKDREKAVFVYSDIKEEETVQDGEKKTVRRFKETCIITIKNGAECTYKDIGFPVTAKDCFVKDIPDSGDYAVFLVSDEKEEDGVLEPRGERAWAQIRSREDIPKTFNCGGDICAYWSYAYHDFVIRGKDMVRVGDIAITDPAVEKLNGYNTLIDITKENYAYRLTFSNKEYKFKTLVSQSTRDRGYIVSVE